MTTEDEGKIGQFLSQWFGRSYRTTLAGGLTVACQIVAMLPGVPANVAHMAQVIAGLAGGAGLLIAKDARVSGRPQVNQ